MAVIEASEKEFEEAMISSEKVVVKYYADWCGSCRLFAPKFKRLSDEEPYKEVAFLSVNAEKNELARKKAGVTNLPFVASFKNGELVEAYPSSKIDLVKEMIEKLN